MRMRTLILPLALFVAAGCTSMIPPQQLPTDRESYLAAVSTSWKEQLLANLVRLRYGDTLTSLEITQVTTSYELDYGLTASNGINWRAFPKTTGFHDSTLIGGSTAIARKPAITYIPIQGDALAKTMLDPIDPSKILKNLQTANWETSSLLPLCVRSVNNLRSVADNDTGFLSLYEEFARLYENGIIWITEKTPSEPKVTTVPTDYTLTLDDQRKQPLNCVKCKKLAEKEEEPAKPVAHLVLNNDLARRNGIDVHRFKKLLWGESQLKKREVTTGFEKYDIFDGNAEPMTDYSYGKIYIQTRSIFQTLRLMSFLITVPDSDLDMVIKLDDYNNESANYKKLASFYRYFPAKVAISSQQQRPPNAFVSIEYLGHWFYIDNTDIHSKIVFSSVLGILCMAETGATTATPILTLPIQ